MTATERGWKSGSSERTTSATASPPMKPVTKSALYHSLGIRLTIVGGRSEHAMCQLRSTSSIPLGLSFYHCSAQALRITQGEGDLTFRSDVRFRRREQIDRRQNSGQQRQPKLTIPRD